MTESCKGLLTQKAGEVDKLKTVEFAEGVEIVKHLMLSVETAIKGVSTDIQGYVPQFLSSYTALESGGKVSDVRLHLKTKLKSKYGYKQVETIPVNDKFLEVFINTYTMAVLQIYYVELAGANVDALNEYLVAVYERENIGIRAYFDLNGESEITSITDTEVYFNLTTEQAHKINTLNIFDGGDAYAERCAALAYDEFVKEMKAIQIAPQLVKAKIGLIVGLTGNSTRKRVDSILRVGMHKADKFKSGQKPFGKGYLQKKMQIDGVETTVFAIVENTEEGIKTVLRPFDTKTMLYVAQDATELGYTF
jgi:hypothetical protein